MNKAIVAAVLLASLVMNASFAVRAAAEPAPVPRLQSVPQASSQDPGARKIPAGPKDLKERLAIYVFLSWLWCSIIVCVVLLRLKVREADRLLRIRFRQRSFPD